MSEARIDDAKRKALAHVLSLIPSSTPEEIAAMAFELGMQLGTIAGKRRGVITTLDGLNTIERDTADMRRRFAKALDEFDGTIDYIVKNGHI